MTMGTENVVELRGEGEETGRNGEEKGGEGVEANQWTGSSGDPPHPSVPVRANMAGAWAAPSGRHLRAGQLLSKRPRKEWRGGGRGASPTQLRAALQKASIQAPCTVRQQGVWQAPPNRGPGSHHRAPGPNRPPWALSPAPVPPHSPLSSKAQCWQIQHGHRPHQGGPRRTTHRPGAAAVHVQ